MPPRVVSCLLAGWLALAPALAAGYEQKQGPAVLRLEGGAEDEGVKARLSDELTLTLTVEGGSPIRFEQTDEVLEQKQVKALRASGVWHGVEAKTERTQTPDGRERWRQRDSGAILSDKAAGRGFGRGANPTGAWRAFPWRCPSTRR